MSRSSALSKARRLERKGQYQEAIDLLSAAATTSGNASELEALVRLRHEAIATLPLDTGRPDWPPPAGTKLAVDSSPPEISLAELDAAALASGILNDGCLLVRSLLDPDRVAELTFAVEQAFRAVDDPGSSNEWYVPFEAEARFQLAGRRRWVRDAGAIWSADSPPTLFALVQAFEAIGLTRVIEDYLGERPVLSLNKSTLRQVPPDTHTSWHQDGAFMGSSVRTVNVWLALSPCGGDAPVPGLDILPTRLDEILETGTHGAPVPNSVGPDLVERMAEQHPVLRPRFAPGDALLFDERFLHSTGVSPGMTGSRLAIESWFFAPSSFPDDYAGLVF